MKIVVKEVIRQRASSTVLEREAPSRAAIQKGEVRLGEGGGNKQFSDPGAFGTVRG